MGNLSRTTRLGSTDDKVSRIGTGTNRWSYGDNDEPVYEVYKFLLDKEINFLDTAEIYTGGKSERLIGSLLRRDGRRAVIASKYMPSSLRLTKRHFMEALDASLSRLGVKTLDLYYVHSPPTEQSIEDLMDYMGEARKMGKIRAVGVSNFDDKQMRWASVQLEKHGIPLAANQVEYSLMHREPERNGLLEACEELHVSLVAYRPLGRGQLASSNSTGDLYRVLKSISERNRRSLSQVALSWLLHKSDYVIPIPGATKLIHARENVEALEWSLSETEFKELDEASSSM